MRPARHDLFVATTTLLSWASCIPGFAQLPSGDVTPPAAVATSESALPYDAAPEVPMDYPAPISSQFCEQPICEPQFCEPCPPRNYLLGDMHGLRSCAAESGYNIDFSNTQFYQGIASGGLDNRFAYGGRLDLYLNVIGQKVGLWEGLIIDLHGETRYGDDVNFETGGLSTPNTAMLFPLPKQTVTALSGVKFTQILNEHLVVFGGKLNLVDGYLHPFAGGRGVDQFMNLSLALPPIFGRTAPYSTLGFGAAVLHEGQPVLSLIVMDPSGTSTQAGFDRLFADGVSLMGQGTLPVKMHDLPGHHTIIGMWGSRTYNSLQRIDYLAPVNPPFPVVVNQESGSWAILYSFDQFLYVDPENPKRGWGVFAQASISDGTANPIRSFLNAGVGGSSPFSGRPADTFGLGWYFIQMSDQLQTALGPALPLGNENGAEFYYNFAVKPWLHVTPDIQVIDPVRERVDTSVTVGVRAKINF